MTETVAPYKEIVDIIKLHGGQSFKYCYQCGICDVVCPWNRVSSFSMRKLVRQAVFGLTAIDEAEIWRCTTCGTCPSRCPRGVDQIAAGVSLRRIATEYGVVPDSITTISGHLMSEGNSLGGERGKRAAWAEGLSVNTYAEGMEILYYPGCYLSYDPRMKKVAVATAKILQKAGVAFGILGPKEVCCGESIRKTGDEATFKHLARENIKTFIDHGVKRILVSSPHCFHTFANEYPEFGMHLEVIHITQFMHELIASGRLELKGSFAKRITYHDPCYLGRHNKIFDQPREVLSQVNGLTLNEMEDYRENSLCCGGGGGRIWMETPKEERFSDIRLKQALDVDAEVLATSCPYCITNFTDSALSLGDGRSIEVKDVTEIVSEVI